MAVWVAAAHRDDADARPCDAQPVRVRAVATAVVIDLVNLYRPNERRHSRLDVRVSAIECAAQVPAEDGIELPESETHDDAQVVFVRGSGYAGSIGGEEIEEHAAVERHG